MLKQVIVVRMDLKMSVGKLAAQSCHASLGSYNKTSAVSQRSWELFGAKKVVLGCADLDELRALEVKARKLKLPHYSVTDAGHTELKPGTVTALGIGPAKEELIDSITGQLKLL
ncbi:MAG: peptidyl-tRNA hydrolase Pth2 [Candidatus Nanoarchaeia archaeon]|jgi:PTH2 family peptidyl-tRNA hydrolase